MACTLFATSLPSLLAEMLGAEPALAARIPFGQAKAGVAFLGPGVLAGTPPRPGAGAPTWALHGHVRERAFDEEHVLSLLARELRLDAARALELREEVEGESARIGEGR